MLIDEVARAIERELGTTERRAHETARGVSASSQQEIHSLQRVERQAQQTSGSVGSAFWGLSRRVAAGIGVVGGGVGALAATAGFRFNSIREQAQIAFDTMLGSGEGARAFLDRLAKFAAPTPFEFPDLIRAAPRLMAMGVAAKDRDACNERGRSTL